MAKRAKKAKAKAKKFLLCWSDCGEMDQLETSGEMFVSIDAAKKRVEYGVKNMDWSADMTWVVAEIVAKSKLPSGIRW